MVDDYFEARMLVEQIKEGLPLKAYPSKSLLRAESSIKRSVNIGDELTVIDVDYGGDTGGIMCVLASDKLDEEEVFCVSITQLIIPPTTSLTKAIQKYQAKRIKRLRRQR